MMGGDGSHFSEIDAWKIIHGFQQVEVSHLFAFLLLIFLCLLAESHPPNEYNPPLKEEDFFCVCLLAWFLLFDMSVLQFVYIAIFLV
jgi:hypothetical protein